MKQAIITLPAIILTLSLWSCGGSSSPSSPNSPAQPPPSNGGATGDPAFLSNITYKQAATTSGNIPMRLDIYQPSDICSSNRPTVLFVHGGGFITGDKFSALFRSLGQAANEKDFNFVSINYRLAGDDAVLAPKYQVIADDTTLVFPTSDPVIVNAAVAAIEDTVDALKWMEANANQYCLDLSRLAYWGSSAGSYTVLNVAYTLDQYNITRPAPDVVINYWGDLVRDADIMFMDAPFLTLHGDADSIVPYSAALELAAQGDAVNVPYTFYTVTGADHAWTSIDVFNTQINGRSILDNTLNFIEAHIVGGMPTYETVSVPG